MMNHGLLSNSSTFVPRFPPITAEGGAFAPWMFGSPHISNATSDGGIYSNLSNTEQATADLSSLDPNTEYRVFGKVSTHQSGASLQVAVIDGTTTLGVEVVNNLDPVGWEFTFTTPADTSKLQLHLSGNGGIIGFKPFGIEKTTAANTQTQNAVQEQGVAAVSEAGPVSVELGWNDFVLLETNTEDDVPKPKFKYEGRLVDLWTWDFRMFAIVGLGETYNVKSITATVQVDSTTTEPSTVSLKFGTVTRSADSNGEHTWDINQTTDRFTVKGWPRGRLMSLKVFAEG